LTDRPKSGTVALMKRPKRAKSALRHHTSADRAFAKAVVRKAVAAKIKPKRKPRIRRRLLPRTAPGLVRAALAPIAASGRELF